MSKYCKITWVKHEWEQLTCFTEWGKERFCTRSRSLTQRFSKNTVSGRTTLVPSWRTRWVLCSYPRWLQRRTDWRVRIWVWIPVGPFGAVEECGKERGNQREQRGLPVIISPQFRLGCGHRWVSSSLVSARLCGLRVEASLRRDCCSELCSHASGRWVQKRAGKGFFFSFMSRQYLFILLYHVVVLSAFGLEGCFHPIGLDGIEEENPTPLCCAVPHPDQDCREEHFWLYPEDALGRNLTSSPEGYVSHLCAEVGRLSLEWMLFGVLWFPWKAMFLEYWIFFKTRFQCRKTCISGLTRKQVSICEQVCIEHLCTKSYL